MPNPSPSLEPGEPLVFGRGLRPLWALAGDAIFLNHGSFGACPRSVLAEQDRLRGEMEAQPDQFFRQRVMPRAGVTALRAAIGEFAPFIGSAPSDLALVENATSGVQAVVRSTPLAPGDEILITDHTYNAVRLIVEARCTETGAVPRTVALPIPSSADAIVEHVRAAMTARVRLAIVDHITSPTALAMPLERLLPELRRWGARVLVDGAHAAGHLALDLGRLGADAYVSNAHKWLFAPKGTAFLYATADVRESLEPLVISHFIGEGFPRAFDWTGTRDYTAWLALPCALRFFLSLDPPRAAAHRGALIDHATTRLGGSGLEGTGTDDVRCAMRSFVLPQRRPPSQADAETLVARLWNDHRIQAMAVMFGSSLLLRVSAQAYVGQEDVDALADAVERGGWPGR